MFQIHNDDQVFQHGITNSLVRSMRMEVIFQDKDEWFREKEFSTNLRVFKKAVVCLQTAWYGEEGIPPVYEDTYSNVGRELKEVLSFPTHGKLRMSDDLSLHAADVVRCQRSRGGLQQRASRAW